MKKYDFITKKFLQKEYPKKSLRQIARELECSRGVIKDRLIKYNIHVRTRSEARKGKYIGEKNSSYIDGRKTKKHYCIESTCNNEISYTNWLYGNKRCRSCVSKKLWQNEEYREKTIKATFESLKLKPNKLEKLLNRLLNKILPNEYKFVGDGKIIIGGFNPDFINCNGQKKIIELYGCYWHKCPKCEFGNEREIDVKKNIIFQNYGYKTLIIWEHELKDLNKMKVKILNF